MGDGVYVLWLEEVAPERLSRLPGVQAMLAGGAHAQLVPLPLAEATNCYYQVLAGIGSGKTGRFDAVHPAGYKPQADEGVPEGAWQHLLPDLVRANQRSATFLEVDTSQATDALEDASADCVIVRLRDAGGATDETIDAALGACGRRAGTGGHVICLTDVSSPAPSRLVNVNNFLRDAGVLDTESERNSGSGIVWRETLAYGLGAGQVWLNMRGREPEGIVEPGREYDEVRAALMDLLANDWRNPETDESVVARVLTREQAFSGEHVFRAPDLVLVFRGGYAPSPRAEALELDGASVLPIGQNGGDAAHTARAEPQALLVGRGPAFAPGVEASGRLTDVVPTVLYLLGLPLPQHLDGEVIEALLSAEYRERTPILVAEPGGTSLSGEDEEVIVGRLQALGYLG